MGSGGRLSVIATVARNGDLRRIEVGFLLSTIVEWAVWLALVVFAFERGGATEAGLVGFAVGVPAIVVAPAASLLGDRWPRARVLTGDYALQAILLAVTAAAMLAAPALVAYAVAIAAVSLVALVRPALAAVLPEVARSPDELTAANVVTGLGEGAGALGGSLLAGVLLGLGGAPLVVAGGAVAMGIATLTMLPTALRAPRLERSSGPAGGADGRGLWHDLGAELAGGAAAVGADRRLTAMTGLMAVAIGVLGALNVLIVVVAIEVLGLEQDAAGYLAALTGVGALAGSIVATTLIGRERLAAPLLISTALFAVTVAAVGVPTEVIAVGAVLIATGVAWSYAYVAATTFTQRLAGDDVMTRVFGVLESTQTGAEAIGGLLVPLLVLAFAPAGALAALGVGLIATVLLVAPILLRSDRLDPAFVRDLRLVRAVPMFAPLSGPVLERLAASAERLLTPAGADVIREGETGDRFYVIDEGDVEVSRAGEAVGRLGPGDAFGEIALLQDVPRTATVRAVEPTTMLVIARDPFLEALTGQPRSRAEAAKLARDRLAADEAKAADRPVSADVRG